MGRSLGGVQMQSFWLSPPGELGGGSLLPATMCDSTPKYCQPGKPTLWCPECVSRLSPVLPMWLAMGLHPPPDVRPTSLVSSFFRG